MVVEARAAQVAREERGSDRKGRKRFSSPPEQPQPKQKAMRAESRHPANWFKDMAIPLGRNPAAGSLRPCFAIPDGGSGAPKKVAPRPLAGSKDGVMLGGALFDVAGTIVRNKEPAVGKARPMAVHGYHGAGTKSSEALSRSNVATVDGLPDTGSQGAAGYTVNIRGSGAGTGELQRKERLPFMRLPPKPPAVSAEHRFASGSRSNAGSLLGRGSSDELLLSEAQSTDGGFGISKAVVATDAGSSMANQHVMETVVSSSDVMETAINQHLGAVQDEELDEGKNALKMQPAEASVKVLNKCGKGSSAQGPTKKHLKSKRVSEIGRMNMVSSEVPARMSSQSTMMKNKIVHAPRKAAKPAKVIEKSNVKEKEAEHGGLVIANGIVGTDNLTTGRATDKCPNVLKNELATNSTFGPKKKGRVKAPDQPSIKVVRALGIEEILDCKVAFDLKDDDILKTAAICEGELKLYIKNSSDCPSRHQRQHEVQNTDAKRKFKMICRRFEFICKVLVEALEQNFLNLDRGRVDIVANRAMKKLPDFSKSCPIEGKVSGVEVGDKFLYRVQLAVVGLHRRYRGGIDWTTNKNGTPIAVSIVSSGGYPDEMLCSGELIYTGSGGKIVGETHDGNQKRKRGNLALENCISTETPVRVIYGFKCHNVEGKSHSRAKKISTYEYDGLYKVVNICKEGEQGSKIFKYMLKKIPGQPELPLHIAKRNDQFQSAPEPLHD